MKLGDYIASLDESASSYARRIRLPIPTVTRYLRGERGLSIQSVKIILDEARGTLSLHDLVPNPYQDNGGQKEKATKKIAR